MPNKESDVSYAPGSTPQHNQKPNGLQTDREEHPLDLDAKKPLEKPTHAVSPRNVSRNSKRSMTGGSERCALDAGLAASQDDASDAKKHVLRNSLRKSSTKVGLERDENGKKIVDLTNVGRVQSERTDSRCLMSPNSPFLGRWDMMVLNALIFTALVTPYEVALLETSLNGLFVVNRMIDFVFVIDMILQFVVIQKVQTPDGMIIIKTHGELAMRYLRGWFCIDFISIFPFDLIGFCQWLPGHLQDEEHSTRSACSSAEVTQNSEGGSDPRTMANEDICQLQYAKSM